MRAAEPGTLAPFVGGATWRGLRIETKADLSALSTRPQGTITITGGADDISLAALDKRLPALGAVTLASDLGLEADGKITVRSLDIGSALASVKGGGSYLPASQAGEAKVTVTLPNLAPLSELAGVAARGQLDRRSHGEQRSRRHQAWLAGHGEQRDRRGPADPS